MSEPDGVGVRHRSPARVIAVAAALALLAPTAGCASDTADGPPTINLYHPPEQNLQKVVDDCNAQARGRYRIVYRVLPRQADEQRVQLVRRLAAKDPGMDVLGLDVTWTQEFASAKWVREWTGADRAEVERGTLAGPLDTARHEGKLYAAPKNTNVQLLWYRADLVAQPPRTWDEMIEQARVLKEQGRPYRVLTMGAQYEGLVVLYNSMVASAGGELVSDDGRRATVDADAVRALDQLRRLATSGVVSPSFSNATEDPVRLEFQAGDAAFQVNWPFVYPALQAADPELARQVRWTRYPAVDPDQPSRATIGGTNLAVSAYSQHPAESFAAARCLRNEENQKFSAINDGVPPTIGAIYDDPEMTEAYPMKETILETLTEPATRPLTPAYQSVSTVVSALLSPPSAIEPDRTGRQLRTAIADALESKGVLP